jgi:hypothetical protein
MEPPYADSACGRVPLSTAIDFASFADFFAIA